VGHGDVGALVGTSVPSVGLEVGDIDSCGGIGPLVGANEGR
jgi:hypothetical protein